MDCFPLMKLITIETKVREKGKLCQDILLGFGVLFESDFDELKQT